MVGATVVLSAALDAADRLGDGVAGRPAAAAAVPETGFAPSDGATVWPPAIKAANGSADVAAGIPGVANSDEPASRAGAAVVCVDAAKARA